MYYRSLAAAPPRIRRTFRGIEPVTLILGVTQTGTKYLGTVPFDSWQSLALLLTA